MQWWEGEPEEVLARLQEAVERQLQQALDALRYETVLKQTVTYVVQLPGKRIRPLLCLLSSALEGAEPWEALPAAAAVEILHSFTLVHDDIMDRSPLRRGQPTVHVRWNDAVAILTGDVLVGLVYRFLEHYGDRPDYAELLHILTDALLEVSEGQALDLELPNLQQASLAQYWQMIDGKTVALLRMALQVGAVVGKLRPSVRRIVTDLAVPLGRAFQVQDDLLDLVGVPEETGKQSGQDLREGKLTYAVFRALELEPTHELLQRYRRQRSASHAEVEQLLGLFRDLGILQEMEQQVERLYRQAFELVEQLPAVPARELLRVVLQQLRLRRR